MALALLAKDLLVLGMGAWGALQILPVAVSRWFPSELAAAVVLLLAGMVLVLSTVVAMAVSMVILVLGVA